jgi:hypothetical protein
MGFQVRSTGDILPQGYPNVCQGSQQPTAVIDFGDHGELCSTIGHFERCGHCVGFGGWA